MNSYGKKFRISIFGESHGKLIGVTMDGVPAGIPLCEEDFRADLDRRRSGAKGTTPRKESDMPHIVSGVFDGCTTGAPLAVVFENQNTISKDYSQFREFPRPGHADFTAQVKHNFFNDIRGGGHFSGRITLTLVAAGVDGFWNFTGQELELPDAVVENVHLGDSLMTLCYRLCLKEGNVSEEEADE